MKLRTYKRILFFLKDLNGALENQGKPSVSKELISFFTDSELRTMIHWLYKDVWSKNALGLDCLVLLVQILVTKNDLNYYDQKSL